MDEECWANVMCFKMVAPLQSMRHESDTQTQSLRPGQPLSCNLRVPRGATSWCRLSATGRYPALLLAEFVEVQLRTETREQFLGMALVPLASMDEDVQSKYCLKLGMVSQTGFVVATPETLGRELWIAICPRGFSIASTNAQV